MHASRVARTGPLLGLRSNRLPSRSPERMSMQVALLYCHNKEEESIRRVPPATPHGSIAILLIVLEGSGSAELRAHDQARERTEAHLSHVRIDCWYSDICPSANADSSSFISDRFASWKIWCSTMTSSLKACEVSCDAITASESCSGAR